METSGIFIHPQGTVDHSEGLVTPLLFNLASSSTTERTRLATEGYIESIGTIQQEQDEVGVDVGYTSAIWGATSDVSAIARNVVFFQGSSADNGMLTGLGFTSLGGIITGSLSMHAASRDLQRATAIGDATGRQEAIFKMVKSSTEIIAGLNMAAVRGVGLAAIQSPTPTLLAVNTAVGISATVTSSLSFALAAVKCSIDGVKAYRFMKGIDAHLDQDSVDGAYNFLKDQLELSEEEWANAITVTRENSSSEPVEFTKEEVKALTEGDITRIQESIEESFQARLTKEVARVKIVKEAEFIRKAGIEGLNLLKAEVRKQDHSPEDVAKVVETVRSEARFNTVMSTWVVIGCVLGIASFILATVFSGGAFLILGLALMLVMNVIMAASDTQGLLQAVESLQKSGWKDKLVMGVMIILTIAAIALGTFFSGGLGPMILTLIVGVVMLGIQAGAMAWAYHKHHNPVEEENPI